MAWACWRSIVSPVVVQVPDFGDRFWVYQAVDLRTDSFVQLGKMYDTKPGFYLLVGPNWKGEAPKGITKVFRASTNTGVVVPRIFQDDTPEDKRAVQAPLRQVVMYPLAEFDGTMKSIDWSKIPTAPARQGQRRGSEVGRAGEVRRPARRRARRCAAAAGRGGALRAGARACSRRPRPIPGARRGDEQGRRRGRRRKWSQPLFQFRNWGQQLPYHWSTISNEAAFGTDYFTRTAVAKSNILVNAPNETKYFYQDLDAAGARLNSRNRYTVTFPKGLTPPVNGFWSLTLYNQHHFFAPNPIGRYSVGTRNKDLKYGEDGSLTIYVQADPPPEELRANWLPTPQGGDGTADMNGDFSLYIRAYWPKAAVLEGAWTPPPVENAD